MYLTRSRSRLFLSLAVAAAFSTVAAPPTARAATHTLSPGQSISAKLDTVAAGDRILLNAGTYNERVVTNESFSTAVTIEPVSGAAVTVNGGFHFQSPAKNITVRGVTVKSSPTNETIRIDGGSSGNAVGSSYITLDNVHVIEGKYGVRALNHTRLTPSHITIKNSEIENVTWDGIQFCGGHNINILDNEIHDILIDPTEQQHNDGVQLCGGDDITISRNLIYDSDTDAHGPNQGIIAGRSANIDLTNVVVSNNLVHHWPGTGITISGISGPAGATVVNNTAWASGPDGTAVSFAISKNTGAGCAFDNVGLDIINNITSKMSVLCGETVDGAYENNIILAGGGGAGLIDDDPMFVNPVADPASADFSLQPGSPAIDSGSGTAAPSVDLRNQPRFLTDRGAIEFMLHDTFTDTAGTSLSAHVGEQHAGWTKHPVDPGTATISSTGRVQGVNSTDIYTYLASWVPPTKDQVVEMKFVYTGASSGSIAGVVARWDATARTGYHLRWFNGNFEIYRFDNGVATALGTVAKTLTVGQTYTIRLSARSTAGISGYFNGVQEFANVDGSPIASTGKVGLRGRGTVAWMDTIFAVDP
jgi:hypothetical protein